jgi:hypothetical protein
MLKSDLAPKSYFITAPAQIAIMSTCTLGIYDVYWMYKQWKAVLADRQITKGSPFWRAIFSVLWVYPLFKGLEVENPGSSAAAYVLFSLMYKLPGAATLLSLASCLPLMKVQIALNKRMDVTPAMRFSSKAVAACVFGALVLGLAIIGLMSSPS